MAYDEVYHYCGAGGKGTSSKPQSLELIEGNPSEDFPAACLRGLTMLGGDLAGVI